MASKSSQSLYDKACFLLISCILNPYSTTTIVVSLVYHTIPYHTIPYHTTPQIRNLEMLKLLFGEDNMQTCEVMLKDFAESKRINTRVHEVCIFISEIC